MFGLGRLIGGMRRGGGPAGVAGGAAAGLMSGAMAPRSTTGVAAGLAQRMSGRVPSTGLTADRSGTGGDIASPEPREFRPEYRTMARPGRRLGRARSR